MNRRGSSTRASRCFSFLLVASLTARVAGAKTWIVPGVINGGAYGVFFSTDVTLVNPGPTPITITVLPIAPSGSPIHAPMAVVLAANQTQMLSTDFGLPNGGALRTSSSDDFVVFARTNKVNTVVPPISFPQFVGGSLPVVDEQDLLKLGETGHSGWVSHSSDFRQGERTNVAVVFPSPIGGSATVTLFDERGNVLGRKTYESTGPSFHQSSVSVLTTADVPLGRIALEVTGGTAWGYTAVVDNITGDCAFIPIAPLPVANSSLPLDLVSAGVIQAAGRNGAFWRTDARLANSGSTSITVTPFLLGSSEFSASPLVIRPRETLEIRDLVQSLFNSSNSATGLVLWRASGVLTVSTRIRTSFADGSTFGAIHDAVPLARFSGVVDPPPVLADLLTGPGFRTNLLFTAGLSGASYDFEVLSGDGALLTTLHLSLPPLGYGEFPLESALPPASTFRRLHVRVRVREGSLSLKAAVADSVTNDPVIYSALPQVNHLASGAPVVPAGPWGGAPNGMDHLIVDTASIGIFRHCQSGAFPQPSSLDAEGRFSVLGTYAVQIGPSIRFDAILSGQTDGHTATVRVTPVGTGVGFLDTNPETFVLGAPFQPFTGLCPIEY